MKVGDLVRLRRDKTLWVIVEICKLGNIGLWNSTIRQGIRWTYTAALERVNESR